MTSIEQYFTVVQFIIIYQVILVLILRVTIMTIKLKHIFLPFL